jgi:hypothetical protein
MKRQRFARNVYSLFAAVLLVQAGLASAVPGRERVPPSAKTWLVNLGEEPARIAGDSISAKSTRAGDMVLEPGQDRERVLVLRTAEDFDPRSLEVELHPAIELERLGNRVVARYRPEGWLADLAAAIGGPLAARQAGRAKLVAGDTAAVAVALLDADSAVDVVLRDAAGVEIRSFALNATVPAKLRLDLGTILTDGAQVELHVRRGRAAGTVGSGTGRMQPIFAASTGGSARYSQTINYQGSLSYYITGGPANTCGELDTYRNGSWLFAPGWVCTDASGNATKGIWTWSSTPSDQTDDPTFIRWPDGTTTNSAMHIWDKNCAVTYRDSSIQTPPTSYYGHATDTMWGAGFDFSPNTDSEFTDVTNPSVPLYWVNATVGYNSTAPIHFTPSLARVNRWYVNWNTVFPASNNHLSGHKYQWLMCVDDGVCAHCAVTNFTMP